jgi:hypothetical protein
MGGRESITEELPFNDRPAPLKMSPLCGDTEDPLTSTLGPTATCNIVNTSWGGALYTISQWST